MYTVQTPGERVQLFIQAKAFRDRERARKTEGGDLGLGRRLSETRGDEVKTDGVRGKYVQRYSNIESVSYRNRKCR